MQERLQKILARAGVSSRRSAEQLITAGRVRVNGRVVKELGSRADPDRDRVEVDGKRIVAEDPVYVCLHKPRGVVATLSDPEGRPTVGDYVKELPMRVFPVGRLDFQTSGVLLLTNDGDFTARMLHPRHHVTKTYLVKVEGEMKQEDVDRWCEGVTLDDGPTLPAEAFITKRSSGFTWFELILREGRNQQIRRMGEATGFQVVRLTRIAFAGVGIEKMHAGQWRFLTTQELRDLRTMYGVPKRFRTAMTVHAKLAGLQPRRGRTNVAPAPAAKPAAPATADGGRPKRRPAETTAGGRSDPEPTRRPSGTRPASPGGRSDPGPTRKPSGKRPASPAGRTPPRERAATGSRGDGGTRTKAPKRR